MSVTPILLVPEITHQMGLVPIVWLGLHGERRPAWWWLGGAFGVSWLADTAAHWVNPDLLSAVYPVSQAAIIGAVLLGRDEASLLLLGLWLIAVIAILWQGIGPREIFLRTVAWGSIVGIVWTRPVGRLSVSLLTAFGLGWVTWIGYALEPGWPSWGCYQGVRAMSLGLFCWASRPVLRLA